MNKWTKIYHERKAQGLCVRCGDEAMEGRTRCKICAKIEALRNQKYYHSMTPEKREEKRAYVKKWQVAHPERVNVYKARKSEYNRRYREGI